MLLPQMRHLSAGFLELLLDAQPLTLLGPDAALRGLLGLAKTSRLDVHLLAQVVDLLESESEITGLLRKIPEAHNSRSASSDSRS